MLKTVLKAGACAAATFVGMALICWGAATICVVSARMHGPLSAPMEALSVIGTVAGALIAILAFALAFGLSAGAFFGVLSEDR